MKTRTHRAGVTALFTMAIASACTSSVAYALRDTTPSVQFEYSTSIKHDESPPLRAIPPLPPETRPRQMPPLVSIDEQQQPTGIQFDGALQTVVGALTSATPGLNFIGVGLGFVGPQGTFNPNTTPPDPSGAIGAYQYVQWVNFSFAVFNKATGAVVYGPAVSTAI